MTTNTIRFSLAMNCIILERGERIHYIEHEQPNAMETLVRVLQHYARAEGDEAQAEADARIPAEEARRLANRYIETGGQITRPGKQKLNLEDLGL